jgi:hypothetical protein
MVDEVVATLDLRENPIADDEVVRRMQFKEEQLSRLQRSKLRRPGGLLEIDFVMRSGRAQLVGPGFICNNDEEANRNSTPQKILLKRCDQIRESTPAKLTLDRKLPAPSLKPQRLFAPNQSPSESTLYILRKVGAQ